MRRDPWLDNVKMVLVTARGLRPRARPGPGQRPQRSGLQLALLLPHTGVRADLRSPVAQLHVGPAAPHLAGHHGGTALPALRAGAAGRSSAALGQREDGPLWLQPHWAMWYLCVLFFWRLATPMLRHRAALPISLGGQPGRRDSSTRRCSASPGSSGCCRSSCSGCTSNAGTWTWVRDRLPAAARRSAHWSRSSCGQRTPRSGRAPRSSTTTAGTPISATRAEDGMRIRLAVMAIGLLGTVSALALVPRGRSWFSTLGSATLVVYLFHGFVVRSADTAGWLDWSAAQPDLALVAVAAGSIGLALLLSAPPVSQRLGALVDPIGRWQARSLAWRDGARPLAGQREDGAGDGGRDRSLVDHGARVTGRNAQIYDFIYYWHIPAFVLVTGYLSRSFTWSRRHLWALFCTIVVPYFIFEFAMLFYREHRGGEVIGAPMWLNPHWPMWYLAGVFVWRMAHAGPEARTGRRFRSPSRSAWCSRCSAAPGRRTSTSTGSIGFLPFFTIGSHLTAASTSGGSRPAPPPWWARSRLVGIYCAGRAHRRLDRHQVALVLLHLRLFRRVRRSRALGTGCG